MDDQKKKSHNLEVISRLKGQFEKDGAVVFLCQHLEIGERSELKRFIHLGGKRQVWLCGFCSGELVEDVLYEFVRIERRR